jgi:hypothetical protein
MDIKEINNAIMFNGLTNEQLESVMMAVKFARTQLVINNKRSLCIGDRVKFTSNRNGRTYLGTVEKIAIKYITVQTGGSLFRVPANMLEAA